MSGAFGLAGFYFGMHAPPHQHELHNLQHHNVYTCTYTYTYTYTLRPCQKAHESFR